MDDSDRGEMRALCDQFRELARRDVDPPLFDHDVRQRVGEMIGRAARQGRVAVRLLHQMTLRVGRRLRQDGDLQRYHFEKLSPGRPAVRGFCFVMEPS